uniref:Uncharacterized protein n=1 Tax=Rhizophora mucronata TaxID=61149 RepID=A0A2P2QHG6_RHIMU
MCLFSGMPTGL